MMRLPIAIRRSPQVLALLLASSCGGGDGTTTGTAPVITPASITITPPAAPIVFGALGRTRTLAVVVMGSNGLPISSPTVTWTSANTGVATVSAAGVVTAVSNGTSNLTATIGSLVSTPVVITVAQVMASVVVSSPSGVVDTLRTATRTRQYTAVAKDSTGNTVTGPTFTWSSNNTAVATVGAATGLVTAGSTFGTASITATSGAFNGSFLIGVALYAATVAITPTTASITTAGGTQPFGGSAADSVGTPITAGLFWTSRAPAVASIAPPTGGSTTATAVSNGTSRIVFSAGARLDSALLTVTGQGSTAPTAVAVNVGDFFFRSVRNNTQNAAIDTVAVGGTVTWTWSGSAPHSVASLGPPSFTSSTIKTGSGTYAFTFTAAGSYTYDCIIHGGSMSGTIVVR